MRSPAPRSKGLTHARFTYAVTGLVRLPLPVRIRAGCNRALTSRRSHREFSAPLAMVNLSTLLWYTGKALETRSPVATLQGAWSHRVTPSAGGIHPIDILPLVRTANGRALCWYDPWRHQLWRLKVRSPSALRELVALPAEILGAGGAKATVIWYTADFAATRARYRDADSLVWRDAGCIQGITTLVAAALDFGCCLLGPTGEPFLSRILGLPLAVKGVGGCSLGMLRAR